MYPNDVKQSSKFKLGHILCLVGDALRVCPSSFRKHSNLGQLRRIQNKLWYHQNIGMTHKYHTSWYFILFDSQSTVSTSHFCAAPTHSKIIGKNATHTHKHMEIRSSI